jgi:uncharacterized lipoprotein YajG
VVGQPAVGDVNPAPPVVTIEHNATSRAALRLSRHMAYHSAMIRYLKLALALLLLAACSGRPGPITVADNVVAIQNQTTRDWRNVVVTVNHHFRGGTSVAWPRR